MTSFDAKIAKLHCLHTAGGANDDAKMQIDGAERWAPGNPEGFVTIGIGNYFDINQRFTFQGDLARARPAEGDLLQLRALEHHQADHAVRGDRPPGVAPGHEHP
ncbi:hypothetical protein [Streptomyces sp. NPDC086989]|uniref:hypothetical protein n=1 Tax=Streptomyces sp. NPDC086989 TaxID=3365764 RepID=UPI00380885D2